MSDLKLVRLARPDDFESWRVAARTLAEAGVPAEEVVWEMGDKGELPLAKRETAIGTASFPVPKAFVELARDVVRHSDPERFGLLYEMLLRLKADRNAMKDESDPLVRRLALLAEKARRNMHQPLLVDRAAMIDRSAAKEGLKHALDAERAIEPGGNLRASWEALLKDARKCTRCDLYKHATQTVFGEGPLDAAIMFVGEQPGDQEDLAGRPFVGPAGQLFDAALEKAGIDRSTVYVTNAVKHFKFVPRGKRRIHNKPDAGEIEACRWWISHERELLRPPVTVALGATAAHSLFGKTMAIGRNRGAPLKLPDGSECWITVHPSFLLRIPEEDRKLEEKKLFLRDLKRIKARAEELSRA
jgi:DNA polymerase